MCEDRAAISSSMCYDGVCDIESKPRHCESDGIYKIYTYCQQNTENVDEIYRLNIKICGKREPYL
jgi:hypothetical protein